MINLRWLRSEKQKCEHELGTSLEELYFADIISVYFPIEKLAERDGEESACSCFNMFANQMYQGFKNVFTRPIEDYLLPMVLDPDGFRKICLSGDAFSSEDWIRCVNKLDDETFLTHDGAIYKYYYNTYKDLAGAERLERKSCGKDGGKNMTEKIPVDECGEGNCRPAFIMPLFISEDYHGKQQKSDHGRKARCRGRHRKGYRP